MCVREPGARPGPSRGWRPGQEPQPWAGNFLRKPAACPGLAGTCPASLVTGGSRQSCSRGSGRTWRRADFVVFSPRRSDPLAARPPRADSNLPPGPQCKPPREGPGSHLREVQLSPRAGSPGAGLHLAAGRLRGAGGCPSSRAGRWAVPWWGRVRAAKFLGRGGRPCKLCRAVTARWPLSARCPRRAGSPCGGRTRKPLRVIPARGSSPPAPVSRFPARVRALRSPRLLPAGQMGRACFGLELEPPELPGCRSLVNLSFC